MKKYKLIKEYPGSDHEGITVSLKTPNGLYEGYQYNYSSKHVENSPEYWEEVIEKDYKILISRVVPQEILSVKRLSDGEVFSVGDRAMTEGSRCSHTIRQFRIKQKCFGKNFSGNYTYDGIDRIWIDWEEGCGGNWLESTVKLKKPIFLTHDGKDIFEGDTVWYVNKKILTLYHFKTHANEIFRSDINAYFLTQEAAKDYVNRNKPRLSIEDCFKILQKSFLYGNGFEKEIEKYVRKNNR